MSISLLWRCGVSKVCHPKACDNDSMFLKDGGTFNLKLIELVIIFSYSIHGRRLSSLLPYLDALYHYITSFIHNNCNVMIASKRKFLVNVARRQYHVSFFCFFGYDHVKANRDRLQKKAKRIIKLYRQKMPSEK